MESTDNKQVKLKKDGTPSRQHETQFGGVRGNPIYSQSMATRQRVFYDWVESVATEEALIKYANDKTNPLVRRNFVKCYLRARKPSEYFDLTNQVHGMPKQQIEMTELPNIEVKLEE